MMQPHFVGNLKLKDADKPGTESWSIKIRRRARTLVKTLDTGYMELAEILYLINDTPIDGDDLKGEIYKAWGYDSFADWAEDELNLHRRKAERLRRIFHDLTALDEEGLEPKTRRSIIELGWSKVREVLRVISVENAQQWVDMAENLSYPELMVAISTALDEAEKENPDDGASKTPAPTGLPEDFKDLKKINFAVFPGQKQTIDDALERAAQVTQSKIRGHNMEMICTDYLATNAFGHKDDMKVTLKYIAKIEKLTGKRIIIVDPDTLDVEYGIGTLEDMAQEED